jgi:hypothetical protein
MSVYVVGRPSVTNRGKGDLFISLAVSVIVPLSAILDRVGVPL